VTLPRVRTAVCLATAASLLAPAALPSDAAAARGFRFGVAAGEVTSTSAMLWARPNRPGLVVLGVRRCGRRGGIKRRLRALRRRDRTVQTRVRRLRPGTRYCYRFNRRRRGRKIASSVLGRFTTAPARGADARITFAYTGDADAQPAPGSREPYYNRLGNQSFGVYRAMMAENNSFNVNLGDTIYSDTGVRAQLTGGQYRPADKSALTRREKWRKYRMNLALANLSRLRSAAPLYSHPDDHEWVNDFGPNETLPASGPGGREIRVSGRSLYMPGVRAFRDYAPVGWTRERGFFRVFHWGRNLDVFFLDERSFRSPKAGSRTIHTCDNPESHEPDAVPTAPPEKRLVFSLAISSLDQPVSRECLDAINSPGRSMLGTRQRAEFLAAVKASTATWKVVMNEVPILQWYGLPYDRWEGYAYERELLLRELDKIPNVVFLSTDHHAAFANVIRIKTFRSEGGPIDTGLFDFTAGPVATNTFKREINAAVGGNPDSGASGDVLDDFFLEPAPDAGLGMHPLFAPNGFGCTATDVFSYGQVTVTRDTLTVQPKDLNRGPVHEEDDPMTQCGPYVLRAER
jgi:phosphodiesterase/alkaline phosphatase D-like protein